MDLVQPVRFQRVVCSDNLVAFKRVLEDEETKDNVCYALNSCELVTQKCEDCRSGKKVSGKSIKHVWKLNLVAEEERSRCRRGPTESGVNNTGRKEKTNDCQKKGGFVMN